MRLQVERALLCSSFAQDYLEKSYDCKNLCESLLKSLRGGTDVFCGLNSRSQATQNILGILGWASQGLYGVLTLGSHRPDASCYLTNQQ